MVAIIGIIAFTEIFLESLESEFIHAEDFVKAALTFFLATKEVLKIRRHVTFYKQHFGDIRIAALVDSLDDRVTEDRRNRFCRIPADVD